LNDSLFGIIGGICKEPGEYSALHSIAACDGYTVGVGIDDVVVEYELPYLLHEIDLEIPQDSSGGCGAVGLEVKVLDLVWKLDRG
jgi:hypothetical protein